MKMPRFILQVAGSHFVISNKKGVGALLELLAEAMPVPHRLYDDPPSIELYSQEEEGAVIRMLQEVVCVPIPGNIVWKQRTRTGEVQIIRPVEKTPKALKAPKQKALPAPKRPALPAPQNQLALI